MPWDEELEDLANDVHEHLGEDVFQAATLRALQRVTKANLAGVGMFVQELATAALNGRRGTITLRDGQVVSLDTFYEVLRVELRRVIRPQ